MNKLRGMFLFSRLAELGSFVAVAEEISPTASMVSKEIQKLEQDIGARLLHRSTRKIQLTPVGEGYLERCRQILAQVNEADAYVQQSQNSMRGKLRINMPMVLGLTDLSLVIADYMRTYPDVELDIHLGDESVDLLEGGFDLGFRASSQLLDSGYVGKPLKAFDYHVCAAPQYLKTHAPIKTVQDLTQHNCFEYSYFKSGKVWPVAQGIKIKGNLKANNTLMIRDAVEAGLGLAFLPGFVAKPGLDSGRLQEVLKEQSKLSKFIEFIQNWFAKSGK